ncbi:uncharacterized protein O3C94_007911 [Discoglossus pictus]
MALMGIDYKLRSIHLLLVFLVSSFIVLGLYYLNEASRRIQLQQEITVLERYSEHVVDEKNIIKENTINLQKQLQNLKNEIKNMQETHTFELQQQSTNFWNKKNDLLKNISLKEDTIQDLKKKYDILKKQFEKTHSELEEFEKNQARLLEKFSTQSTQCMRVITMMKELCDEKKGITLKKMSKPILEKEIIFNGFATGQQTHFLINQTGEKYLTLNPRTNYTTQKAITNLEFKQDKRSTTESSYRDPGVQDHTPTTGASVTSKAMLTSLKTDNENNGIFFAIKSALLKKEEQDKPENMQNEYNNESNKESTLQTDVIDFVLQSQALTPGKEETLKVNKILEIDNDNALISERETEMEETITKEIANENTNDTDDNQISEQHKNNSLIQKNEAAETMNTSANIKYTKSLKENLDQRKNKTEETNIENVLQTNENVKEAKGNTTENEEQAQLEAENIVSSENENLKLENEMNINTAVKEMDELNNIKHVNAERLTRKPVNKRKSKFQEDIYALENNKNTEYVEAEDSKQYNDYIE